MATDDLIALPRFSYTALDFETIISDIRRIIIENPAYNESWEDFLESNAGKMIIELISYIVDILAFRVDWKANENFIGTATQKQSAINLLKLINYRITLPQAASAKVDMTLSNWVEPFDLPSLMSVTATDRNGDPITFELIPKDADGEFIYFGDDAIVTVNTGTITSQIISFTGNEGLTFFEGSSRIQNETMQGIDNETIVLNDFPVIENSIQIWTLNANDEPIERLPLVNSFVAEDAQQKSDGSPLLVPPFMIDVDADNKVTARFASSAIANIFTAGDSIRIYYRIGGGSKGNIVLNSIRETKSFVVGGNSVLATFTNNEAGSGGASSESVNEAKKRAPLYITTADKTVTPLDYKRILLLHPNILTTAAYGKVNEPAAVSDEYGYTIPTFETWIYAVPSYKNWSVLDPRTEYNTELQLTKPYEIKNATLSFSSPSLLTGTISFDPAGLDSTKVTGNGTLFPPELEPDDAIAIPGTGTGSEIFVGVVDTIETGTNDILHLKNPPLFAATNQNFGISSYVLQLPSEYVPVYPRYPAINIITGGLTTYLQNVDYVFDYDKGLITRYNYMGGFGIPVNTPLSIMWWYWDQQVDAVSDVTTLENYLKNKKMVSIDNVYIDTLYTAFDIKGIVYVEKNYNQNLVKEQVESLLFLRYSLLNQDYSQNVQLPEIIALIQSVAGVRYVSITYFGVDYSTYKNDPNNPPDSAKDYGREPIEAKYNEIIVLSKNEFIGATQSVEFQLHGMILDYTEVVE